MSTGNSSRGPAQVTDTDTWRRPLKIGHITPSCNSVLEPLTVAMSGGVAELVSHHFTRIPVTNISLADHDLSQFETDEMVQAARLLADARLDAILWNGTSGAWKGIRADEEICRRISEATGIPASTSTLAQIEAMREYRLQSCGLAVPYTDDVAAKMTEVLEIEELRVCNVANLGMCDGAGMAELGSDTVRELLRRADHPDADCVVLSCTGVAAGPLLDEMERELGKPILDTIAVTLWKGLKMLGVDVPLHGWGRLLARELATTDAARDCRP